MPRHALSLGSGFSYDLGHLRPKRLNRVLCQRPEAYAKLSRQPTIFDPSCRRRDLATVWTPTAFWTRYRQEGEGARTATEAGLLQDSVNGEQLIAVSAQAVKRELAVQVSKVAQLEALCMSLVDTGHRSRSRGIPR